MIAGATTPEQVEQNVGAAGWTLSAEDLAEIDRIAAEIERVVRNVPGVHSALAERLIDTKLLSTLTTPGPLEEAVGLCLSQGLLRRHAPEAQVADFRFKAVRPTFDLHPFQVNGQVQPDGKTVKLWAQDHEGWLTMDAVATVKG